MKKLFLSTLCLCCTIVAEEQLPNVVFIFADDLGYGDLSCYGATKVRTPHIDRLAAEGRKFTDAHSASAVCTPSRYALLTGEYPHRRGIWGPCSHRAPLLIDTNKLTLARLFKNKGYATSCFGKWHLGFGKGPTNWNKPLRPGPLELGFDHYFGIPKVNSGFPYVYVEDDRIVGWDPADPIAFGKKPYSPTPTFPVEAGRKSPNRFGGARKAHEIYHDEKNATVLTEKAVTWIEANKQKPFFLYLPTTNIHHPCTPAPRFKGTSQCGLYGDFIHELDWMVGEILACLERNRLAENTIVIFTSDNGGMFNTPGQIAFKKGHKINGDLLGFKFGVWEGGHRVPFIVRWPGKVKAGTTSGQLICNIDMLATFASVTGQPLDKAQQADSVNMLPAFVGDPGKPIRSHLILAPNKRNHLSVRRGKWMFIPSQGSGGFTGRKPGDHTFAGPPAATFVGSVNSDIENGKIKPDAPPAQLYDLENDRLQTRNLYREHPEVVKELRALLQIQAPKSDSRSRPPVKSQVKTKYDQFKPLGNFRFSFESGKLEGWTIIEGAAGRPVSDHASLPRHRSRPYNHEGKFHLSTIATADGFSDKQKVVFQSPKFVIQGDRASFLASGGFEPGTLYVGLLDADSKEVLLSAGGPRGPQMMRTTWDVSKLKGKTVFLQVVDRSIAGWGHLTFDDFSVEGKLRTDGATKPGQSKPQRKGAATSPARNSPNVIFMLTDDLGYSDIGCYGAEKVKTPHIDRLAAEGIRFTDFHTAASICSPSRAAFLTGAYPQRAGLYMGINPNRTAHWFLGLHPDEITLAEQFKRQGYATHMVGKWHLGTESEFLPRKQGFDHYYGMPCNFAHSPKFFDNDKEVFARTPLDRLTQLYTERVTSIIREKGKSKEPFFLYYAHNYPHTPYQAGKEFKGTSHDGVRGDVMQELDWSVGEMMKALKEAGIADNTIIVFTSDNGPTHNRYAKPYRGTKYVTFEGGHRVPFIFHWPGRIKPGSVSSVNINAMDVFPALSEVIDAPLPTDRVYDGESLLPLFDGKELKRTAGEPFHYYNCENLQAMRRGDWKLHLPREKKQLPFWDKNRTFANLKHPVLYNLRTDHAETTNVAADHPKTVQQMLKLAASVRKDLGEFMERGKAQRPTGSLFPGAPVISHEKDWSTVAASTAVAIEKERMARYANWKKPNKKRRK